jgi:hypothetical protein
MARVLTVTCACIHECVSARIEIDMHMRQTGIVVVRFSSIKNDLPLISLSLPANDPHVSHPLIAVNRLQVDFVRTVTQRHTHGDGLERLQLRLVLLHGSSRRLEPTLTFSIRSYAV